MTTLFIPGGLASLIAGAELLVCGASRLAQAAGIPALTIGRTVVAFRISVRTLRMGVSA